MRLRDLPAAVGLVPLAFYLGVITWGIFIACTVTPEQHAANVGEATMAGAEYAKCRVDARDGGTFASFCACVRGVDAKHHIDGGPCE